MSPELWQKATELFHAALERTPQSRDTFLQEACGEDADLRRYVELLIRHDQRDSSLLEQSLFGDFTGMLASRDSMVDRQFGPYRITSFLGSGGMGEVYRAHDTELGRDVAVKILPPEFARNPERLARFRREARSLASLNHPNIATVYRLETSDALDCPVLELVEGETLHCPQPLRTALDYAGQVAEALEAAHEKGIIHRDLKPANIKVTPGGRIKVLDFGLAKAIWGTETNSARSQSTECAGPNTLAGNIVGTPGYMSPEQSLGEEVDQRADIWAFGCLFYEFLTGGRAFPAAIPNQDAIGTEAEVDWQAVPPATPAKIRELLGRCLEKNPARRLSRIEDARRCIEEVRHGKSRWPTVAITTALATIAIAAVLWQRGPSRLTDHSEWIQLTKFPGPVSQPALSPDGTMLAFVRGPLYHVWTRPGVRQTTSRRRPSPAHQ